MKPEAAPLLSNHEQFHKAIGSAVSGWQQVEESLGTVFCALMGDVNHAPARAAYTAVINFSSRLSMVHGTASRALYGTSFLSDWSSIHQRVNRKSQIRNRLVHFSATTYKTAKGEHVIALAPSFWDTENWRAAMRGKGIRYNWRQIWQFGQDFGLLAMELSEFARKIDSHLKRPGADPS